MFELMLTWSPTANRVTPSPRSATKPTISWPRVTGKAAA